MRGLTDRVKRTLRDRVPLGVLVLVFAIIGLVLAVPAATATDGIGTMTVPPTVVTSGSSGHTLTFTYTAGPEGLNGGSINVQVPSGWSEPSSSGTTGTTANQGYTTSTCGTVAVSAPTIKITGIDLPQGASCDVVYGSREAKGPGANSPATLGPDTFTTQEASTPSGTPTTLPESPAIRVFSPTVTATPALVGVLTSGITLTFSFGGVVMNDGEIVIAAPAGWPEPSTAPSAPGYTTSTCGKLAAAGGKLEITEVNLPSAESDCAIEYGVKGAGGPGASSPTESTTAALETFRTEVTFSSSTAEALQTVAETGDAKVKVSSRELTILISGKGTVAGSGVSCSEVECKQRFPFGTAVALSATPASGYTFLGWGGEACSGTGTCTVTLNEESKEATVIATFHGATTTTGGTTTGTTAAATTGAATTGTTTGGTGGPTSATTTTTGATTGTGTTGAATTGGTAAQSTAPTCSLKAPSSKIKLIRKHGHAKGILVLIAKCNQTVNVELEGEVSEQRPKKHRQVVQLHRAYGSLTPGRARAMKLALPASALSALKHHAKESAKFTLVATSTENTSDRVVALIKALTE